MYYQVTSSAAREEVFITYSLSAYVNGRPAERPALEVRVPTPLQAGMHEFAPEIDVSLLERGTYQLEVRIATGRDAPIARRLTTITLD